MGFVERRPSETDKRVLCVYPTEKMQEFLPGLEQATEDGEEFMLQVLEPEEQAQLITLLRKVRKRIEEA